LGKSELAPHTIETISEDIDFSGDTEKDIVITLSKNVKEII